MTSNLQIKQMIGDFQVASKKIIGDFQVASKHIIGDFQKRNPVIGTRAAAGARARDPGP